jgi:hypothetical protein
MANNNNDTKFKLPTYLSTATLSPSSTLEFSNSFIPTVSKVDWNSTTTTSNSFAGFKGNSTFEEDYKHLVELISSPATWIIIESMTKTSQQRQSFVLDIMKAVKNGNVSNAMIELESIIKESNTHRRQFDQIRLQASQIVIDNDNSNIINTSTTATRVLPPPSTNDTMMDLCDS